MDNTNTIQSLYDQSGLLDILLGIEEYFDNMDLYAYKNWIKGEVVEGPIVSKYWVEVILKYTKETFPDPRGALIFEKNDTKVTMKRDFEIRPLHKPRSTEDMQPVIGGNGSNANVVRDERIPILLVKFVIPRVLVNPESFNEYKLMISSRNDDDIPTDPVIDETLEAEVPHKE